MPEIIEVERLRTQLAPHWTGRRLAFVRAPKTSPNPKKYVQGSWEQFRANTKFYKILRFDRHGKHLWLATASGAWQIHLGGTGWFYPASSDPAAQEEFLHAPGNVRLILEFDDGQIWHYHDARTWGVWYWREGNVLLEDPYFKDYGPDWLKQPGHAEERLLLTKTKRTVKEVLCDQRLTAGLGNYLSVEICSHAGIHPHQPYNLLKEAQRGKIIQGVHELLRLASTEEDREYWRVFKKAGQPCRTCAAPIQYVKDRGGSRGSYFCDNCQPMRK